MPYNTNKDLPEAVKTHLPEKAQDIYRAAFNNAWEEYADPKKRREVETREDVSLKVAWAAVKNKYVKKDGKWVLKEGEK